MKSLKQALIVAGLFAIFLLLLTIGIHTALKDNALGFDYLFYYEAGRALFKEGLSPYSIEVIQRIQMGVYGRLAQPGEYPYPFPYPLPILFVPLPLYFLSYDWSQAAWMALNLLAPLAIGMLLFTRAPKWLILTLPLFYQMSFTWIIGNYALLIGMVFIVVFYVLFYAHQPPVWADVLCGISLAWVTNKPQMVWLYLILALFVALHKKRRGLIIGFFAGLAGFHLIAFALQPGWPLQWLSVARYYPQQTVDVPSLVTYLDFLLPTQAAWIASAVLALPLIAITIWLFIRWRQERVSNLLLLSWCALITSLTDLSALTPDQIVMLVPVFLWAAYQPPTKQLKIGWFAAIIATYVFFFLTQFKISLTAVDRAPLLVYVAWLIGIWRSGQTQPLDQVAAEAGDTA